MNNDKTGDDKGDGGREKRAGANATAQGENKSASTATVTVACKLPHGLWLDLTAPAKPGEDRVSRRYLVKGANGKAAVAGFGLTDGVPEDFWAEWLEKNRFMDYVTKRLIFAYESHNSSRDAAKDRATQKSGFEPIVPPAKNPDMAPGKIAPADLGV